MKSIPLPIVHETKRNFSELSLQKIDRVIRNECGENIICEEYGKSSKHSVIILPSATKELEAFIHFGELHPNNQDEQQFRGIGHYFIDKRGAASVVVTNIQYIYSASRGKTYAKVIEGLDTSMYDRLNEELKIINNRSCFNENKKGFKLDPFVQYGDKESVLLGHTHPNLGAWFSGVDLEGHSAPKGTPRVSLVCDPHRLEMSAIVGAQKSRAQVLLYREGGVLESNEHDINPLSEIPLDNICEGRLQEFSEVAAELISNGLPGSHMKQKRTFRNKLKIKVSINLRTAEKKRKRVKKGQ